MLLCPFVPGRDPNENQFGKTNRKRDNKKIHIKSQHDDDGITAKKNDSVPLKSKRNNYVGTTGRI